MKTFNLKEFNQHGTKFFYIHIKFDYKKGFTTVINDNYVCVKPNTQPCFGCDFMGGNRVNDGIILSNSMSSDNFYEVKKPDINMITNQFGYLEITSYCLVENKAEVLSLMSGVLRDLLERLSIRKRAEANMIDSCLKERSDESLP